MKTDLFQACGHCSIFHVCWHIECSTIKASSFRIWNSSAGVPSPPLALLIVRIPKAHLTLHSKTSGSRWGITLSWLSRSIRPFLYSSSVYSCVFFLSVQLIHSVMSDSLWPHGLQQTRLPCPSPTPGVYSNSCSLSWWCHPTISSSVVPFSSCPQSFPVSGSFPMSQVLRIQWPKYWSFSFSISPSNECSGLISFRMDYLDLLAVLQINYTPWKKN